MSGLEPILSVRELSVFFRGEGAWRPAVAKLSFDVGPRETLAVVGESGSGKSVTALAVMGLLPTANSRIEGVVRLDGRNLSGLSDARMRAVRGDAHRLVELVQIEPKSAVVGADRDQLAGLVGGDQQRAPEPAEHVRERCGVPETGFAP